MGPIENETPTEAYFEGLPGMAKMGSDTQYRYIVRVAFSGKGGLAMSLDSRKILSSRYRTLSIYTPRWQGKNELQDRCFSLGVYLCKSPGWLEVVQKQVRRQPDRTKYI